MSTRRRQTPGHRKHVPQRTCVACRAARAKRDLVRIVRLPDGMIVVDETGKQNGRGAYLCRQRKCWDQALAQQRLDRALKTVLTPEIIAQLREYATKLPQILPVEFGKPEEVEGSGEI